MKVMHILGNFGPGGAEMGVVRLIKSFRNDDIIHSVCSIGSDTLLKGLLPKGTNLFSLGIEGRSYRAFIPLFRLMRSYKIDIAHVNNMAPWFDVALASKLAGCKCIETFHGVEESALEFSLYRRIISKTAYLLTSSTTAVAESARDLLVQLVGIKEHKIRVLPNGVDTELFSPMGSQEERRRLRISLNLPENGFLMGCVAALRPVKDHKGLVEAFASAISDRPSVNTNKDIYLILVGDGPLTSELKTLSGQLGVEDRIVFLDRRNDVDRILQALDVFVLNSKTEGMSYAVLEAMSSGLPIIATNVGANTELIRHGVEGYLYRPGDLKSLTEYMTEGIGDRGRLLRMGRAARQKIVEFYSVKKMVSSYKDLYEVVLSKKNG
jgi:glycosyltransferase involved in cell wall biosynthesis